MALLTSALLPHTCGARGRGEVGRQVACIRVGGLLLQAPWRVQCSSGACSLLCVCS